MNLLTKMLLGGLVAFAVVRLFTMALARSQARRDRFMSFDNARRATAKSIARHYRKGGAFPAPRVSPTPGPGARVVREKNDGSACFSVIEFGTGEQVMISIANGEVKIFRMALNGVMPIGTLWESSDADQLAKTFANPARPYEHPLESIRNKLLTLSSASDLATL